MSHTYPSDITRKQFEKIRHILEGSCKSTRPRTVDLYDVFCSVLYILKIGCRSSYFRWSEGENELSYYRCAECQKLGYSKK